VIKEKRGAELFLEKLASTALEIVLIEMPEKGIKFGGEMLKDYQIEIEKLESAVKALLFIVAEYVPTNLKDDCGRPIDLGDKLKKVRASLKQTQTFKSSWKKR
tara:strand:- start:720 stop:1028 length:309 start_codon:yes stop_codon:yes gene_type:complete